MNLAKSFEVFDPTSLRERIHIIGCGAGGSTTAEMLARYGLTNITLYDDDKVDSHNIANQMFRDHDIGKPKVEALRDIMCEINPEAAPYIQLVPEKYENQELNGYVFLCVDNIDVRREIVKRNRYNKEILAMFDSRNRLYDGQLYAADWHNPKHIRNLLKTMEFSHEEAMKHTPVSGCNLPLSVCPTIRVLQGYGVMNFINCVQGKGMKNVIMIDGDETRFAFHIDAYEW